MLTITERPVILYLVLHNVVCTWHVTWATAINLDLLPNRSDTILTVQWTIQLIEQKIYFHFVTKNISKGGICKWFTCFTKQLDYIFLLDGTIYWVWVCAWIWWVISIFVWLKNLYDFSSWWDQTLVLQIEWPACSPQRQHQSFTTRL